MSDDKNKKEKQTVSTAKAEDNPNAAVQNEEKKEKKKLTPEEERESKAIKLTVSLYEDGRLEVMPVQNVGCRSIAEYVLSRAKEEYTKRDIANLTAMTLLDTISRSKKSKSVYVPGE